MYLYDLFLLCICIYENMYYICGVIACDICKVFQVFLKFNH